MNKKENIKKGFSVHLRSITILIILMVLLLSPILVPFLLSAPHLALELGQEERHVRTWDKSTHMYLKVIFIFLHGAELPPHTHSPTHTSTWGSEWAIIGNTSAFSRHIRSKDSLQNKLLFLSITIHKQHLQWNYFRLLYGYLDIHIHGYPYPYMDIYYTLRLVI